MILTFKDVVLKRLELSDIEMLRNWRNDPEISERMFYNEFISESMQLKWFQSLKSTDFYFIINYKNKAIGLINLSNENAALKEAESGLFIAEKKYWGGPVSIYASLALLRFAFEERNLNQVLAKVRKDNVVAIKYNEQLGFKLFQENWLKIDKKIYQEIPQILISKLKEN